MRPRPFVHGWQRLRAALATPLAYDALAAVAGAVLALAFAPFDLWPLAVVAPALLFHLWRPCGRGRAAWRGWLFGVGLWGAGVYWIYHSLHLFGAAVAPLAGGLTVLFVLVLALLTSALGALTAGCSREHRGPIWYLLILPGAWVVLEWIRSWLLTGFPWLLLGTSQLDTWLAGYAPVVGVYGVSLAVAISAGALALALTGGVRDRLLAPVALVLVWSIGAALSGATWTRSGGLPFDAALIQGNIDQTHKFGTLERTLELYKRGTREAADEAELVVWPETAVPTFYDRAARSLNAFSEDLRANGTRVVTGVFVRADKGSRYYNAVRPLGPAQQAYRKQHLVPFGEYMPLRELLAFMDEYIKIPMSDIAAGRSGQPALKFGPYRLGASVCFEVAYPGIMRGRAARSTVLLNVSNDAWFGDSSAPHQHLQIARMRALETARPLLRATNTGISAIIDPHGVVIARAPQFRVATVQARVEPRAGLTPYVRMGDWPAVVAALLLAFGPWLVALRRRRAGRS